MKAALRSSPRGLAHMYVGATLLALGAGSLTLGAPCACASPVIASPVVGSRVLASPGLDPRVVEGFVKPPPDPPGTATPPPSLEQMVRMIKRDMRRYFDRAQNPRTHRVSRQGARRALWGYALEHFRAMDRRRDGELSFSEVWGYVRAHLPRR